MKHDNCKLLAQQRRLDKLFFYVTGKKQDRAERRVMSTNEGSAEYENSAEICCGAPRARPGLNLLAGKSPVKVDFFLDVKTKITYNYSALGN